MAINWNNVAAPNLGESNSLFAQAIQSLKDAGAGLKDTAKDYQTVVRNKSHAILQDYINSAKTPEELQSEAFNTGFKNLQATLANEYDAVKVNDYRDNAVDKLTKRAGDAVALKRNTLGLATDEKAIAVKDAMANLYTITDPIARKAEEVRLASLNLLDPAAAQSYKVGEQSLIQLTDANNLFKVQKPFLEVQPKLANEAVVNGMSVANRNAATAEKNANTQAMEALARKAEAEAKANGGGFTLAQGEEATVRGIANVRKIGGDALAGVKDKFTFRTMDEVDADVKKTQWIPAWMPNTAKLAKAMIQDTPEIAQLPNPIKAAIYKGLIDRATADNTLGSYDWFNLNRDKYFTAMLASAKEHTGYIEAAKAQEKVAIQDFAVTVNRMSGKASNDAFGFKYAHQQLGVSALDGYGASPDILDKLNKGTVKQPAAPVTIRQNRAPEVQALNEKYLKTKDLGEKLKLMHQMTQMQQQYEAGTQSNLGAAPESTAPTIPPVAEKVQKSVYTKSPLEIVSEAVTQRPTPLLPTANQNAFKSKANNLSIDTGTGKTTPAKNPVAIPDVPWGKPVQAVTLDPILAKLPQHTFVATFVPDGDTVYGTSKTHTTVGQPQGKIKCRVDSVNAPETSHKAGQPTQTYGEEAGKILQKMILNKEVSIRVTKPTDGSSNYGRDVCQIEVSGKDVSVELIREGAAWLYPRFNHYGAAGVALQGEAQAAGRGLWQYPAIDPETFSHANR